MRILGFESFSYLSGRRSQKNRKFRYLDASRVSLYNDTSALVAALEEGGVCEK